MKTAKTLLAMLLLAAGSAQALIISVAPSPMDVGVNDLVAVDVMVDDLNGSFIGAYDVTTTFDASVLAFDSAAFDVFLDIPFSILDVESGSGYVRVSEVSFDSLSNQDGFTPFRLFSLYFIAIAAGTSELALDGLLGDDLGLSLVAESSNGLINVEGDSPVPVPAPSTLALLLVGLAYGLGRNTSKRGALRFSRQHPALGGFARAAAVPAAAG